MKRMIEHDAPASGFETITVTAAAAVGLTSASYSGKRGCFITVEDNAIRYRYDGSDPTDTSGHLIAVGEGRRFMHPTILSTLKMIGQAGGTATVQVSYY